MPKPDITIVEVGPRDGLQNEPNIIPTDAKIEFINDLSKTGLSVIEAGSMVSPTWVPQLADSEDVLRNIDQDPNIMYPVLIPNLKGLERAMAANVKHIAVFTAASETFSQKNTNCSINESLARIQQITEKAKPLNINIRAYISCVLGCPYEGKIKPQAVVNVAEKLCALGCDEISLGDTIGVGTANDAKNLIQLISQSIPTEQLAVHFHDTYGQALTNIYASLEAGIRIIDSAVAGLGGCPYAKGASGNVATEDVVYLLNGLGLTTGVDLNQLVSIGQKICQQLKRQPSSKVNLTMSARKNNG